MRVVLEGSASAGLQTDMQLTIRRYERHDQRAVLGLHRDGLEHMGADAGPGPWDVDLDDVERSYLNAGGDFIVGLISEVVVAMGALRRVTDTTADLKRLRVKRELQGKGVGERIARVLIERASELTGDYPTYSQMMRG